MATAAAGSPTWQPGAQVAAGQSIATYKLLGWKRFAGDDARA